MTGDRWPEIDRLCAEALERHPGERQAFLDDACADDPDLRREVESLLAAQAIADTVFAVSAIGAVERARVIRAEDRWAGVSSDDVRGITAEPLANGTQLGPYAIETLLGAGGMGQVYRARDTRLGRDVAVKVLPRDFAADPDRLRRFHLEARAIAALNHPNILAVFDVGESRTGPSGATGRLAPADGPPVHYLVTEMLEGETLRDRIARGPLSVPAALDVALQVIRALGAAHARHIVHRDLKPSNVFLSAGGHVTLLDFGIAKFVEPGASGETGERAAGVESTDTSTCVGTPGYTSPEQALGQPTDARSDIFSFGAVLYEMLAGRRAFGNGTTTGTPSAVLATPPPPLIEFPKDTPDALRSIVLRCLVTSPEDRFQSADDVARELSALSIAEDRPRGKRRLLWFAAALLVVASVAGAAYARFGREAAAPPASASAPARPSRTHLAVLPLRNPGAGGPQGYLADGLHDELITQLAKVRALSVVSRASVMEYQPMRKTLRQIAAELGVGAVVDGSVEVAGARLRVRANLVDTVTGQVLWSDRFDRPLDEAFSIQSEIAQAVVAGVGAILSGDERTRIETSPTTNAEAYRLYLQGRDYFVRPGMLQGNWETAQRLYERALALDPTFALAHAALSRVHGNMHWFRYDPSPSRLLHQREEAYTAVRLAPNLPQGHLALGFAYYYGLLDYRRALDEFEVAERGLPNDAELWSAIGYANRRLGRWKAISVAYERATQLDPRSADIFYDLGGETFTLLHRYDEAVKAYDRALSLAPDMHPAECRRAMAFMLWNGSLEPWREMLGHLRGGADLGALGSVPAQRSALLLLERDPERLLQVPEVRIATDFDSHIFFFPSTLYAGWAYELRRERAPAQTAFAAAVRRLDAVIQTLPDDWRIHAARGLALAGVGRREDALAEARWLQEGSVYRGDAHFGTMAAEFRALILARAGSPDAALDEIERLLPGPSWMSVHSLRLDPRWDPIRGHPRFHALLRQQGTSR